MLWFIPSVVCLIAVGRALTVTGPAVPPSLSPAMAHEVWVTFATKEPEFRAKSAENFPADLWSQDDDFFASERHLATSWASEHGVSRQSVFSAIDQGMREKWPLPSGVPAPVVQVAPCKPRAIE